MDAQRKAALRLRALGGDEAALDELLNVLTAQKDTAIAQKDAAIAIAEQTVLAAIHPHLPSAAYGQFTIIMGAQI